MQKRASSNTLLLAVLALIPSAASAGEKEIVYYDPDGNQQAIVEIAKGFNDYLQRNHLALRFQPVQRKKDLDAMLSDGTPFAIVAHSAMATWTEKKPRLLLLQESAGDVYYRKKLVDDKAGSDEKFSARTVAVSMANATPEATAAVLSQLRGMGLSGSSVIVVPVVKDVDALLGLGFQQVQAALVTQGSIEVIRRINPLAAKKLRIVAETNRIPRAPLYSLSGASALEPVLIDALLQMDKDNDGKRAMRAMGFDRWVEAKPGVAP